MLLSRHTRRREVIAFLASAGAVAWPTTSRAQQNAIPVVGLLSSVPFEARRNQLAGFHQGLNESGFVEGRDVRIEYRWADNRRERLQELAADLIKLGVAVIVTIGGDTPILAAKGATLTTPVVFVTGGDPVKHGFVASLNRPGGNLTGVSFSVNFLVGKRVQALSELNPTAGTVGLLVNPSNPNSRSTMTDAQEAVQALGRKLFVLEAAVESEIDEALATFSKGKAGAILVEADPFFLARHEQIVALAAQAMLPAIYAFREFPAAGGLISYGTSLVDAYRQAGAYAGRILKGEKPADLQSSRRRGSSSSST
jgi:putative tryptophan/tyrosine transport system substrate-binding protein